MVGAPMVVEHSLAKTSPRSIVPQPTQHDGSVSVALVLWLMYGSYQLQPNLSLPPAFARRILVQLSYAIGVAEPLYDLRRLVRHWKSIQRRVCRDYPQELGSQAWCHRYVNRLTVYTNVDSFHIQSRNLTSKNLNILRPHRTVTSATPITPGRR